jgi:HK97 family phage major capsid protein
MNIDEMKLEQVNERLAALEIEVRDAQDLELVEKAADEKAELLARKAELETLEQRKATVAELNAGTVAPKILEINNTEERKMEKTCGIETPEYRSLWLKNLQGTLSDVEKREGEIILSQVSGAMPTITANKIAEKLTQEAPLLAEIELVNVAGGFTMALEGTNTDASLHTENALMTPSPDTVSSITLGGYEIVKFVRISATVRAMTVDAFENFIVAQITKKIARKINYYLIMGTGSSMPKGIDYARTWSDTSTAVDWDAAYPTPAELVEQVGLLGGGYQKNAKWLMSASTFWTSVFPYQDDSKYSILNFNNGTWYLLGFPVLWDDQVNAGDIFFGDFYSLLLGNLQNGIQLAISTESGFAYNSVDYRGVALFDCDIKDATAVVKGAATITAG